MTTARYSGNKSCWAHFPGASAGGAIVLGAAGASCVARSSSTTSSLSPSAICPEHGVFSLVVHVQHDEAMLHLMHLPRACLGARSRRVLQAVAPGVQHAQCLWQRAARPPLLRARCSPSGAPTVPWQCPPASGRGRVQSVQLQHPSHTEAPR